MTDKQDRRGYHQEDEKDMLNLKDNIEREGDMKYNRRAFLKTTFGATVALAIATLPFPIRAIMDELGGMEDEYEIQKIIHVDDLPVGDSYQFNFPTDKDPATVVRLSEDHFVSYNIKCTHMECPVMWEKDTQELVCPCHNGKYDVNTGHPIAGPPPRELPKVELLIENGEIYAVGRKMHHEA